jgi:hypothetical protein
MGTVSGERGFGGEVEIGNGDWLDLPCDRYRVVRRAESEGRGMWLSLQRIVKPKPNTRRPRTERDGPADRRRWLRMSLERCVEV